jgi:hypothetical protein
MKYFVKKKIGNQTHSFEVEGKNLQEVVEESKKLSFPDVDECGLCQSKDLTLDFHVAQKKFKYTYVKCLSCGATVNFGQQMANPDVFYLRQTKDKHLDWKIFRSRDEIMIDEEQPLPF